MKKKIIFLLGGSPLQADLLRAAKDRYHVVVIDGNEDCALRSEADEFVHLDFSDVDQLYQLALAKDPSLILTMASEPGNLSAAIVSSKLGLKYNSDDVVYSTINKIKMKKKLVLSEIPTARYTPILESESSNVLTGNYIFPCVVKPSQSSAGRGVRLVSSTDELNAFIADAKKISKDGCALVEEFIVGDQYSVETISCEGRHHVLGITQEYFGAPPFFAETQQLFPAIIDSDIKMRIENLVLSTLDCFGVRYGACHVELRVTYDGEIYIIEIASRMGGWRSELIRKANGVEYSKLLLQSYENNEVNIRKLKQNYCLVKMIFTRSDVEFEKTLRKDARYAVSPVVWLKDSVSEMQSSLMDSAGYYFVEANNREDARNAL